MHLSKGKKFSYALGGLGKDMAFALSTIMFIYFSDYLKVDPVFLGVLFFVARIWDAVNDPVMGLLVDNTRTRFGKFIPWIATGTLLNILVTLLLFSNPDLTGTAKLVFISATYILWGMTYTVMDIPYWAMIPAFTYDQGERERISVLTRLFTSIGFFLVASPFIQIVKGLGRGDDLRGFFLMAAGVSLIFALTMGQMVFRVREQTSVMSSTSLKEMFGILKHNDQLLVVMVTVILFNSVIYITTNMGYYFFVYDIGSEGLYATFVMVAGGAQLAAIALYPLLSKALERTQIFGIAVGLPILSFLGLLSVSALLDGFVPLLIFFGITLFLGLGLTIILQTVMLADTVEYGEWKLQKRNESINFSVQTFVVKFATATSSLVVGIGLKVVGFVPQAVQTTGTIWGIRMLMFVLPIFGLMASYAVFKRMYKLDKAFYRQILFDLGKEVS